MSRFLLCAAPLALLGLAASAKAAPQPLRSFTPADFARFAPRNALDMVEEIPGFVIRDESGAARGLGQADANILLNGQRISGKSNGAVDALSRIPAADVVRLEIVEGASLEIGGLSGQVLNVITRSAARLSGQFRFSPQVRSDGTPLRWGNGEVSLSGGGRTEWTLSLRNDQQRSAEKGPEQVRNAAGSLIDFREERFRRNFDNLSLSGSLARTAGNGNILNLTGEVGAFILRDQERSERSGPGQPDRVRLLRSREDEVNHELGADYSFALVGGRLKLVGYRRYENSPTVSAVRFAFADGRPDSGSVFTRQANEAETIARAEYTLAALGGDWQLSVEGARNWLDIEAELQERDLTGTLRPRPFAGATSRVGESRGEATLTYGRPLSATIRLQASLGAEYSRIAQTGDAGLVRDFTRPKGFLTLDWQPREGFSFSAKLERVVGQLDFFDFIASANLNDDRVNVSNVNIVPPQSWLLELEGNMNFGSLGSLTLRTLAEDFSDIVDQIPIAGGGEAPGNIDEAQRYGLAAELTLLSPPLGWAGGRLNLTGQFYDSRVRDPVGGFLRTISDDDWVTVQARFRQDFARSSWATGLKLAYEKDAPSYFINEISRRQQRFGTVAAFVENKNVLGLTARATAGNLLRRAEGLDRTILLDRATNAVAFTESRRRSSGATFTLDLEGSF